MQLDATSTIPLRTGRNMPVLGLGTASLKDPADTVVRALQLGYMLVDTSDDYGTQVGVGEGLRASGVKREDYFVTTKITGGSVDAFERAQRNMSELGLPYADLMLIHWPPETNVGQHIWEGLMQAKQDGFTTDIGVSNYSIDQMQELVDRTGEIPVVNQIEWSPFGHDMDMLDFCRANQIVIQAYSPLTHGERLDDPKLLRIAESYSKTPGQILIRWNLQLGTVPVIKATSEKHLQENINVFDFELSSQDIASLNELNELYSALGTLSYAQH